MSEAATPSPAPAPRPLSSQDDVVDLLLREQDAADTDAAPDAPQPPAPVSADPLPGDEAATEPEAEPQPEPEPTFRVKVRGVEMDVPLSELRNGYSRTEDYKAKTAEIAEQRRAAEQERAAFSARVQQLDQLVAQAPFDPVLTEGSKTDWVKLAQENPAEAVQKRMAFDARLQFWQQVEQQRQAAVAEQQLQARARGDAALREALPEWADDSKRSALQKDIRETFTSAYGFRPEELGAVTDHRLILAMRDATLWRKAQAARAQAEAKKATAPAPKVASPGAQTDRGGVSQQARDLLNRAQRTNRVDDQVNAALALLRG